MLWMAIPHPDMYHPIPSIHLHHHSATSVRFFYLHVPLVPCVPLSPHKCFTCHVFHVSYVPNVPYVLHVRGEREFPFPTIPGNTGLPFPFPKFGNEFFIPVPVPKSWECNFLFPFPFPKFGNVIFHSRSHYREWIIMSGIEWEWS